MRGRLALLACLLALAACGGGDGAAPPQTADCRVPAQRASLLAFMQDDYLWSDALGRPDDAAGSMDAYFGALLNKPVDRYSYTQTTESYNQVFAEGRRTGYGYTLVWTDAQHTGLRIRNLEPLGPAALAGVRRGDTIIDIDGLTPAQIDAGLLPSITTPGVQRTMRLRGADGAERVVELVSADFPLTPLTDTRIFEVTRADGTTAKVGYLAYNQFVRYSQAAYSEAIRSFKEAGVNELVLDLRYNGGGSVAIAQRLASLIGGSRTATNMFAYLRYNAGNTGNNWPYRFLGIGHPSLMTEPMESLSRLVVITSASTASSSELLIHGLRPFMPVVLVGTTTYGKPYGSVPRDHCGTVYNAMQFRALNALGESDFTSGFAPTCAVPDDLDHALAHPREKRLAAALDYIRLDRCPSAPMASAREAALRDLPARGGESVLPAMHAD
jgi:carboxyl-terminal processing protease